MKVFSSFPMCALLGVLICTGSAAQESSSSVDAQASGAESSQAADFEQLRQLREALIEAVVAGDVEKQIQYVQEDVVTIWQNNQVAIGHDGVRKLLSQVNPGGENIFQGYTEDPSSDEVTILPGGNAAIAYGKSVPHYKWLGLEFDLVNRWSATLIKTDGQWKIATYHVSGNILDNPVIDAAKQSVYLAAGVALLIGLVLGAVGAKLMQKRRGTDAA